jgi:endonuclease IV
MNDSRFDGLPIILETKNDLEGWKREINYLYSLVNEKASKRVGAGKSHVKATMPC